MARGVERIEIEGYRSLRSVDLGLSSLNVLIGSNGAGKSNFLSAFRLLNALTESRLQMAVGQAGGANALLYDGAKKTPRMSLSLHFRSDTGTNSYRVNLVHVAPDELMFADETLEYQPGGGKPITLSLGGGHRETRLPSTIDAGGKNATMARFIKWELDRWRSYHFHDTSDTAPVKQTCDLQDNRFLRGDARNLAAFLYLLKEKRPAHYAQVRNTVRLAFPLFEDFALEPLELNPNTIRLGWREKESDQEFGPHQLSDGTLRFICISTLLLQPFDKDTAPHTITVDEPELGLHPAAIVLLAAMLREASEHVQIIVSTQSASLLGAIDSPESIIVVERSDRDSRLRRIEHEQVASWLEEYTLGDVWEKGVIGGRP